MFCTKCGKQLHDEDIFCAHCGNRVRAEEPKETVTDSRYSDIVFNPPFKLEAQQRVEEFAENDQQYSREPKKESISFNWDLDGFAGNKPKEEEDFKFNWDDVLDKKKDTRDVDVEKIVPKQEEKPEEPEETEKHVIVSEEPKKEDKQTGALSIEELEKELFGEAPSYVSQDAERELEMTLQYKPGSFEEPRDKFNTYNAKRDAFQELLDRERAHIEKLEKEHKSQWGELTSSDEKADQKPKEPPTFEDIFVEPELLHGNHLQEVETVLPPATAEIVIEDLDVAEVNEEADVQNDMDNEFEENVIAIPLVTEELGKVEEEAAETESDEDCPFRDEFSDESPNESDNGGGLQFEEELTQEEKTKLRFSDVFPSEDINYYSDVIDDGDDDSGEEKEEEDKPEQIQQSEQQEYEDDEEDEVEKKRVPFLKVIIIILAILVAAEVVIIGAKVIAPESGFSKGVDKFVSSVTGIFGGGEQEQIENDPSQEPAVTTTYITEYINGFSTKAHNIGSISEDNHLKYSLDSSYAFEQIAQTKDFQNDVWKKDDDGKEITFGQAIVESIITHYNSLRDNNALAEGLVGVNKLEIGEIRALDSDYYVLNKVTYAKEDGSEVVKHETTHLTSSNEAVAVKEVKEEAL